MSKIKPGIYETIYGNAVEYIGGKAGYDLDSAENVPVEMIDFTKFIRKVD